MQGSKNKSEQIVNISNLGSIPIEKMLKIVYNIYTHVNVRVIARHESYLNFLEDIQQW